VIPDEDAPGSRIDEELAQEMLMLPNGEGIDLLKPVIATKWVRHAALLVR
jgi:hypothetical protein